jgi:ATPase subunit of ABC transporter with duplicated ATPase domains
VNDAILEIRALEAGYTAPIIGPVSFDILPGEVLGLVGPNGSGKSTLLKAIADDARVFAGEIRRKSGLDVAWMEQQAVRLPEMPFSGREYLHFAAADREPPPGQMLAWLDQRIDSLSGGQFQLLRCWAVLACEAELVLLDEPTNNLDTRSERALADALNRDYAERSVLLVSHDRDFLKRVCDRVLEIREWVSN